MIKFEKLSINFVILNFFIDFIIKILSMQFDDLLIWRKIHGVANKYSHLAFRKCC